MWARISCGVGWGFHPQSSSPLPQFGLTEFGEATLEIDVVGLRCPLPVLKLKKRVAPLAPGALVKLITSDETTLKDVPGYCNLAGHRVLSIERTSDRFVFWIQMSEAAS